MLICWSSCRNWATQPTLWQRYSFLEFFCTAFSWENADLLKQLWELSNSANMMTKVQFVGIFLYTAFTINIFIVYSFQLKTVLAAQLDEQRRIADDVSKATQIKLSFSAEVHFLNGTVPKVFVVFSFGSVSCEFLLIANLTPLTCPLVYQFLLIVLFALLTLRSCFLCRLKIIWINMTLKIWLVIRRDCPCLRNIETQNMRYYSTFVNTEKVQQFSHS